MAGLVGADMEGKLGRFVNFDDFDPKKEPAGPGIAAGARGGSVGRRDGWICRKRGLNSVEPNPQHAKGTYKRLSWATSHR